MPAASKATTAVQPPEAASVGETYTTVEATRYAMAETTPEMGDTYAVETHAVMGDCPFGAYAVIEAAAFEVREPQAVVDVADIANHSMVETVMAEAG